MSEVKTEAQRQRPRRHIVAGVLSALVGCGCGLILAVLVSVGSLSAAATLDPTIMSIQPFLIALSALILVGTIVLNMKLEKCCSLSGLITQKKLVATTVAVYVILLCLFLFVVTAASKAQVL